MKECNLNVIADAPHIMVVQVTTMWSIYFFPYKYHITHIYNSCMNPHQVC